MHTLRLHLQRWSAVAFLAIFSLALLPTASRLLAHATGSSAWAEICTPQGVKSVAVSGEQPAPTVHAHLDHCPLCGLAGSALAPPTAVAATLATAPLRELPLLFGAAPRPLHAWAAPQPRGPPMQA